MFDEKHLKRKKLVEEYFEKIPNYPKIGINAVYDHLPQVWKLMKDNDVLPAASIDEFVMQVQQAQNIALFRFEMDMVRANQKPPKEFIKCEVRDATPEEIEEKGKRFFFGLGN